MKLFKKLNKSDILKKLFFIVKARDVNEGSDGFERYTGVGVVKIVGVNPNKEELGKLLGREITNDPVYIYPQKDKDDQHSCRVSFVVKTTDDEINGGIDLTTQMSFQLRDKYLVSNKRDEERVKVIDTYGQTAWATREEVKEQRVPLRENGKPNRLIPPFRPAYQGEEELIEFLKTFFNVQPAMKYDSASGEWSPVEDLESSKISLGKISDYFEGKVDGLRNAVLGCPDHCVKVLFYVRQTEDNKQYQSILTDLVLRPRAFNHEPFEKKVSERQQFGGLQGSIFTYEPISELKMTPTSFQQAEPEKKEENPWF